MDWALTFDDVLLVPGYSEVLPREVDLTTRFSRNIELKIPIVSAAMDTVTEEDMAIAMAREGGIGVIHRNMPPDAQAEKVRKVKRAESWIVRDPITLPPEASLIRAKTTMEEHGISGIPVVDSENRVVGIVTRRDLLLRENLSLPISKVMRREVITANAGVTLDQAKEILLEHGIEKLPVVDEDGRLTGLITLRDIEKKEKHPDATLDEFGRLRVAAAIGPGKGFERRVELLLKAEVDVLVIDTAHGHSKRVIETVRELRTNWRVEHKFDIVAGNVATFEGTKALIEAGADAIKIGVGPGSICTTRVVAGIGMPQITAIMESYEASKVTDVPLIADGGIRYSGDIVKAIASGASSVMIGSLLAGTEEAPGESVLIRGRRFKVYRGMGSLGAMMGGSADRYQQEESSKFVPEGVEGVVPYRGPVSEVIFQLVGGLRSGMGYIGAKNITELRHKARFVRVTPAGVRESHPHDILITREAPNYFTFNAQELIP